MTRQAKENVRGYALNCVVAAMLDDALTAHPDTTLIGIRADFEFAASLVAYRRELAGQPRLQIRIIPIPRPYALHPSTHIAPNPPTDPKEWKAHVERGLRLRFDFPEPSLAQLHSYEEPTP